MLLLMLLCMQSDQRIRAVSLMAVEVQHVYRGPISKDSSVELVGGLDTADGGQRIAQQLVNAVPVVQGDGRRAGRRRLEDGGGGKPHGLLLQEGVSGRWRRPQPAAIALGAQGSFKCSGVNARGVLLHGLCAVCKKNARVGRSARALLSRDTAARQFAGRQAKTHVCSGYIFLSTFKVNRRKKRRKELTGKESKDKAADVFSGTQAREPRRWSGGEGMTRYGRKSASAHARAHYVSKRKKRRGARRDAMCLQLREEQ
jgi:hypothetical protein